MWMTAGTVIQEMMGEQLDVELLLCVYACMYILNSVLLALCLYIGIVACEKLHKEPVIPVKLVTL